MINYLNEMENAGIGNDKPVFPISVVSEILGVHQRTLRIYDEANILSPSRSAKNRRLYSVKDIEKGKFIQYLTRELGINLAGIKIIFYLLDQQKVDSAKYLNHVSDIALKLNITPEEQQENRIKLSRRGRKPSKDKQID